MRGVRGWVVGGLASALLLGCASIPAVPLMDELESALLEEPRGPRWPDPPAEARVVHLGSISRSGAFEPRPALWRRVLSAIRGAREEGFVRPASLCVRGTTLAV